MPKMGLAQIYFVKKGDNILTIIEKNLPAGLTEQQKDLAQDQIKDSNLHIRDWFDIEPGTEVDLSNISFETKEIIYIEDDPDLYLDQAKYSIDFMWALNNLSYIEDFETYDVQSDTSSAQNFGINMKYSYGKSPAYLRWNLGYYKNDMTFNQERIYYGHILKERFWGPLDGFIGFWKDEQRFQTLDEQERKTVKDRDYYFVYFGLKLNYIILGVDSWLYFDTGVMVKGAGDGLGEEKDGYRLRIENRYYFGDSFFLEPFVDYTYIDTDRNLKYFLSGLNIGYSIEIL